MATFQKTLAENFTAKPVVDTSKRQEATDTTTTHLEGQDQTNQLAVMRREQESSRMK